MQHEDGHCDGCGCELHPPVWLNTYGCELCQDCAIEQPAPVVAIRHEERDNDGR